VKISKEFRVGLLAVIALTILYLGFNFLKGIDFVSPNNTYYAVYDDIDGLNVSNPVMINGFSVGRVSEITILQDRGNKLLVSIDVNDEQILRSGTRAVIVSDLLGTKAIHLDSLHTGTPLKDGDSLLAVLNKGITDQLSASAMPLVDRLEVTLQNLNTILANLANNEQNINGIIGNFKTTSENLAKGTSQLESQSRKLDQLLTQLNHPETGLGALMSNMNQIADSVKQLEIDAMLASTKETVDELGETLRLINQGEGSLGLLMTDKELYNKMNKTMEDLDLLFIDMQENPNRYIHFSVFGKKDKKDKKSRKSDSAEPADE